MPATLAVLDKELTPEEEELLRKRAILDGLEAKLADRELELATLQTDLKEFEKHYLQTVGRRFATLDDLKAQIAEARANHNPQHQHTREQARQARSNARESARAAGEDAPGSEHTSDATPPEPQKRSESLKKIYRKAALHLHPDRTLDPDEKEKRNHLFAEVNEAYSCGDEERIRAILSEWESRPENVHGEGPGVELVRIIRMISQVERRLKTITFEFDQIRMRELFKLKKSVDEARTNGRDYLKELSEQLDQEVTKARDELERVKQ